MIPPKRRFSPLPTAAAILLAALPVLAQQAADAPKGDKPKEEAPAKVDSIEVTQKRDTTSERRDATASKIVIGREEIEQYGDTNLGDVMRRLPGVTQSGRPGRGGPPRMRGMAGGFTQILINGGRIPPGVSRQDIAPEQVEPIRDPRAPDAETRTRAHAGSGTAWRGVLRPAGRHRSGDGGARGTGPVSHPGSAAETRRARGAKGQAVKRARTCLDMPGGSAGPG